MAFVVEATAVGKSWVCCRAWCCMARGLCSFSASSLSLSPIFLCGMHLRFCLLTLSCACASLSHANTHIHTNSEQSRQQAGQSAAQPLYPLQVHTQPTSARSHTLAPTHTPPPTLQPLPPLHTHAHIKSGACVHIKWCMSMCLHHTYLHTPSHTCTPTHAHICTRTQTHRGGRREERRRGRGLRLRHLHYAGASLLRSVYIL